MVTFSWEDNFYLSLRGCSWAALQVNSRQCWGRGRHRAPAGCFGFRLLCDFKENVQLGWAGEEQGKPWPLCSWELPGFPPGATRAGLCAKAAIKLWQPDKSSSIHSSGWHHFFSPCWLIINPISGTGREQRKAALRHAKVGQARLPQGPRQLQPSWLVFGSLSTAGEGVAGAGRAPGGSPRQAPSGPAGRQGWGDAGQVLRLCRALCSPPPQALLGRRAVQTLPCTSVPQDPSVGLLFLATLPHNPKGRPPLAPHGVSALRLPHSATDSSFCTVFKLKLMLYSKRQS